MNQRGRCIRGVGGIEELVNQRGRWNRRVGIVFVNLFHKTLGELVSFLWFGGRGDS